MVDPTALWVSSKEAAHQIGVTQRTLYRFIDEGRVPAYRIGRVIRLKQPDVAAFIEQSRVQPGTLKHLYPDATTTDDAT
ncbi:MAG: hypothetical protein CL460_03600 [Acidimicrobiaceae bacterium]|nr:hypothetical protein [Acidimicrobiaceae bacterium]